MAKCGECLMNAVEVVELGPNGICPRCGADYGDAKDPLLDAIAAVERDARALSEFAEDTCDVVKPDGTVCGAHIGYGVRLMHLRVCDEHAEDESS